MREGTKTHELPGLQFCSNIQHPHRAFLRPSHEFKITIMSDDNEQYMCVCVCVFIALEIFPAAVWEQLLSHVNAGHMSKTRQCKHTQCALKRVTQLINQLRVSAHSETRHMKRFSS